LSFTLLCAATKSKQQEASCLRTPHSSHKMVCHQGYVLVKPNKELFCSTFIIARTPSASKRATFYLCASFRLCKFANKATSGRKSILEQHLNALMERSESVKVGKTLRADFLRGKSLWSASYLKQISRAKSIHWKDEADTQFYNWK
jgi:hypothetical protein